MSDVKEVIPETGTTTSNASPEHPGEALNSDWYWRGIRLKYYCAPLTQVALVGLIAFMTVCVLILYPYLIGFPHSTPYTYRGMSSALGGAGGGGLLNTHQSTNANVAVYSSTLLFFSSDSVHLTELLL